MAILAQSRVASAPARRQGFARFARRLTPPLTAAGAPAQMAVSSCLTQLLRSLTTGSDTKFLTSPDRYGVYFILKSMEVGTNFRVTMPKYPTADPNYRIVSRQRSRDSHYYFYIRDQVLGPLALCVGSFLPCSITYYLNGHHFHRAATAQCRSSVAQR